MFAVIEGVLVQAHMPDMLEIPYRPHLVGSGLPGGKNWTCRLGGLSGLADAAVAGSHIINLLDAGGMGAVEEFLAACRG